MPLYTVTHCYLGDRKNSQITGRELVGFPWELSCIADQVHSTFLHILTPYVSFRGQKSSPPRKQSGCLQSMGWCYPLDPQPSLFLAHEGVLAN